MAEEFLDELNVGLSEEEKADLENMIQAFKEERSATVSEPSLTDVQEKLDVMSDRMIQMGETILKFDRRMTAFHEIIRLFFKKSEIMNERIGYIIESLRKT
jgi:ABC-type uncharacterized transport system ATPase subunit